jgi:hypothetical protein
LEFATMMAVQQIRYCRDHPPHINSVVEDEEWCFNLTMAKIFNAGASRGTPPTR